MTRLKSGLFWLSIALNVFLIGAYLAEQLPRPMEAKTGPEAVMPYEKLGLSAKQQAVFKSEGHRFHSRLMQTREAIRSKQDGLIRQLSAENPDRAAINVQQQEILNLQGRLQHDVIAHLLVVSAPLSQAQRQHFFALLRQRMASQVPANLPAFN